MITRTLTLAGLALCLQGALVAQNRTELPAHTAEEYAEARLALLYERLEMRPDQLDGMRKMLVEQETRIQEQRELVRRNLKEIEERQFVALAELDPLLDEKQRELLMIIRKEGGLPLSWEALRPGTIRGREEEPEPKKEPVKAAPPKSRTTLSK